MPTQRRRPRDLAKEQLWRRIIRRHQQTDLPVCAFCQREGLKVANFLWWRRLPPELGAQILAYRDEASDWAPKRSARSQSRMSVSYPVAASSFPPAVTSSRSAAAITV